MELELNSANLYSALVPLAKLKSEFVTLCATQEHVSALAQTFGLSLQVDIAASGKGAGCLKLPLKGVFKLALKCKPKRLGIEIGDHELRIIAPNFRCTLMGEPAESTNQQPESTECASITSFVQPLRQVMAMRERKQPNEPCLILGAWHGCLRLLTTDGKAIADIPVHGKLVDGVAFGLTIREARALELMLKAGDQWKVQITECALTITGNGHTATMSRRAGWPEVPTSDSANTISLDPFQVSRALKMLGVKVLSVNLTCCQDSVQLCANGMQLPVLCEGSFYGIWALNADRLERFARECRETIHQYRKKRRRACGFVKCQTQGLLQKRSKNATKLRHVVAKKNGI